MYKPGRQLAHLVAGGWHRLRRLRLADRKRLAPTLVLLGQLALNLGVTV
jgi:hypothetical protein